MVVCSILPNFCCGTIRPLIETKCVFHSLFSFELGCWICRCIEPRPSRLLIICVMQLVITMVDCPWTTATSLKASFWMVIFKCCALQILLPMELIYQHIPLCLNQLSTCMSTSYYLISSLVRCHLCKSIMFFPAIRKKGLTWNMTDQPSCRHATLPWGSSAKSFVFGNTKIVLYLEFKDNDFVHTWKPTSKVKLLLVPNKSYIFSNYCRCQEEQVDHHLMTREWS